jgi:hypothetical protein
MKYKETEENFSTHVVVDSSRPEGVGCYLVG